MHRDIFLCAVLQRKEKKETLDLWLTLACTGSLTGTNTHSRTAIVSFVFLAHFSCPPPLSLFLFCFALIFCPSLCCYLMELCRDVRFYVRWQQSRQVKATLSSLKTTCKHPTYSLAPFTFSPDHSPCCFAVANPPPPPRTGSELCSEMSNWHPVAEKH